MEVIEHWTNFLGKRFVSLLQLNFLDQFKEKWKAACDLVEPSLPQLERTGSIQFPPNLYNGECAIVLCNHLSDLDWAILLAFMNPDFCSKTKRRGKRGSTAENKSEYEEKTTTATTTKNSKTTKPSNNNNTQHASSKTALTKPDEFRPTAFTHRYFADVPVIGDLVKDHLMTLETGISDEEIVQQIRQRQKQGSNVFILFPEGGILDKTKYEAGREFWNKQLRLQDPYEYKEVQYPRFRAYQALVKTLGTRLKYIVDITLMYGDYTAKDKSWNYDKYPSIIYGARNTCPPVKMHTQLFGVHGDWQRVYAQDWLVKLWKLKDEMLLSWRKNNFSGVTPSNNLNLNLNVEKKIGSHHHQAPALQQQQHHHHRDGHSGHHHHSNDDINNPDNCAGDSYYDAGNSFAADDAFWIEVDQRIHQCVVETVTGLMQDSQGSTISPDNHNHASNGSNSNFHNHEPQQLLTPQPLYACVGECLAVYKKPYNGIKRFHSCSLQSYTAQLLQQQHYPTISMAFTQLMENNLIDEFFKSDPSWKGWIEFHDLQIQQLKQNPTPEAKQYHFILWATVFADLKTKLEKLNSVSVV